MSQPQYAIMGDLSQNELAYLVVGLSFVLAAAGWLLIAQPVKHVKNTHHKTKSKTAARKPAKRKLKKK